MFAPSKNLTRILKGKSWTIRRFATPASTTDGSPSKTDKPMFGTVPSHRSYIFLHATEPPTSFPARFSTPIQRALQLQVLKWGGGVNFAWFGHEHAPRNTGQSTSATAFSALGGRLEFPEITLDNVDEVAETLKRHADGPIVSASEEIHLYVCTHGARDCRCGDMGGAVFKALQDEVKRLVDVDPSGAASRVRLGEVAHVGGHQYAANLLVYPHGEWLGMLEPQHVPSVLSTILKQPIRPLGPTDAPLLPHHWRGRMGLSKDDQLELYISYSKTHS